MAWTLPPPSRPSRGGGVSYGRDQKYRVRPRHLYALLFPGNQCYIGQTVDLDRRKGEHLAERGGWMDPDFTMVHLGTLHGTHAQAEEHEFAWRYKAAQFGWSIRGRPPMLLVDPTRRMTWRRHWIALGLRWPREHRLGWPKWVIASMLLGLAVSAGVIVTSIGQALSA